MHLSLLYGGVTEVEVSIASAQLVWPILVELGHTVDARMLSAHPAREVVDLSSDAAVILLHGGWGEDGRLQAVLELCGMAFTGSRTVACALSQDKLSAKAIFDASAIPTPPWQPLRTVASVRAAIAKLGFPIVVKPSHGGSSEGVFLAADAADIPQIESAVAIGPHVAESYVAGNILTVPVIDIGGAPRLLPIEIVPTASLMYDNAAKRLALRRYNLRPSLPFARLEAAASLAEAAHRALGCSGITRVDIINSTDGPVVLEVNAIPGMGPTGNLVTACEAQAVTRNMLVRFLLESVQ